METLRALPVGFPLGDISAKKRWHEHFGRDKLRKLLVDVGFSVVDFDGAGFFGRVIGNMSYFLRWIKPVHSAFAGAEIPWKVVDRCGIGQSCLRVAPRSPSIFKQPFFHTTKPETTKTKTYTTAAYLVLI